MLTKQFDFDTNNRNADIDVSRNWNSVFVQPANTVPDRSHEVWYRNHMNFDDCSERCYQNSDCMSFVYNGSLCSLTSVTYDDFINNKI